MGSHLKIRLLNKIRENDDEDEKTLDAKHMREYLEKESITVDTFNDMFTFDTALDILGDYGTGGATSTIAKLEHLRASLVTLEREDILQDETDVEAFRATINKELSKTANLKVQNTLVTEFAMYITIRDYARRSLEIEEEVEARLEEEKIDVEESIGDSVKSTGKEFVRDVKKNWRKMSGKERLAAVGAIAIAAIWLSGKSENKSVQKAKDGLWWTVKYGGFGLLANYGIKLFTGKSGIDHLDEAANKSVGNATWWENGFKTDEKKAETLRKSMVYMDNLGFVSLAKCYKAADNEEVDLSDVGVLKSDMSPKECYIAMDTFFSRYDVDDLIDEYKDREKPISWSDAVSFTMVEDGRLTFKGNIADRVKGGAYEYGVRAWNWIAVGEGIGVGKKAYLWWHGKEGTDIEVKKFVKEKFQLVKEESEIPTFLDGNLESDPAKNYKLAWDEDPDTDTVEGASIRSAEVESDSSYACITVPIEGKGKPSRAKAVKAAQKYALEYFEGEYGDNIDLGFGDKQAVKNFVKPSRGAFALKETSFTLFARLPLKGSIEYSQIKMGLVEATDDTDSKLPQSARGTERFKSDSEILYNKLPDWNKKRLRLAFYFDSEQTDEIDKICAWYTDHYQKTAGGRMTFKEVLEEMLTNEEDKKNALRITGVNIQNLSNNKELLDAQENKIIKIEEAAAARMPDSAFEKVLEELRVRYGYDIRLAILGDTEAKARWNYDPNKEDAQETLLDEYEKRADDYVENRKAGR